VSVQYAAAPARGGRWDALRYDVLLPLAARSRALGGAYGRLCAAREWAAEPDRRALATARIARVLGVDAGRAAGIFRHALESEAREEAEVAWLMRHLHRLPSLFAPEAAPPPDGGPCIWATLHLGSPILAILHLACVRGLELQIVGRPLDDANPMPPAKRRWGERKVAWIERVTGAPFLGVSAEATARARSRVLEGASLFVLMDVPGDVVARSVAVDLGGLRVQMASGVFVLAGLLRVPVRPIVAVSGPHGVELRHGAAIEPVARGVPDEAIAREMGALVRDLADEWWMWPYMPEAS
jgi:hypothetical protein